MTRKIPAVVLCVMISLMALPSAHGRVLPVVIHCSASGSGNFFADWDSFPPLWEDIVATGVCAADDPGKTYTVRLTGSGDSLPLDYGPYFFVGTIQFYLDARLTNLQNGRSKTYPGVWVGPGVWFDESRTDSTVKWVIANPGIRISPGIGSVNFGSLHSNNNPQKLKFAWTFLTFQTP